MREAAYGVKESASTSLLGAAESIRREAVKGGNDEMIRQAHKLARSMEKAAVYLDSHTFDQIGTDAAETVRENPWQALGIAFIIGLLIGVGSLAWQGWVGLALIAICWPLNWTLPGLRTHLLFFPLWLGYTLAVDALTLRRSGSSLRHMPAGTRDLG